MRRMAILVLKGQVTANLLFFIVILVIVFILVLVICLRLSNVFLFLLFIHDRFENVRNFWQDCFNLIRSVDFRIRRHVLKVFGHGSLATGNFIWFDVVCLEVQERRYKFLLLDLI